jgi:uncharacterized protein (TIGR03083 family)
MLDHEWFCARAGAEIEEMASLVGSAPDISAPVVTCPEWTIADLTRHTGLVHRWAAKIVASRAGARIPFPDDSSPWESADGWAQWLASGAVPLLAALREAGPDETVWTWGPGRIAGWWARRMLHETAVHRCDTAMALGQVPSVEPVAAADGISEFLANLPSSRRAARHLGSLPAGESMHLHATDGSGDLDGSAGEWLITFADGGVGWSHGHAKASAAVRGPVEALLLFVYGRIAPSDPRFEVFGDPSVLAAWQSYTSI